MREINELPSGAVGLTPDRVIEAALDVLDEKGFHAVSVRAVAGRLGVRMNTVLWHVKSKARLVDLMADAILGDIDLDDIDGPWQDQVQELMLRLRRALLGHRDGALVVSGTFVPEPNTLRVADTLVAFLLAGSDSHRRAAWTAWSLFYFALGLTQEEQAAPPAVKELLHEGLSTDAYPSLSAVLDEFASAAYDERFAFGIESIIGSLDR